MKACNKAVPSSYELWFSTGKGQAPHENEYPYLEDKPKKTCPLDAQIFNSGAKVVKAMKDHKCNEERMQKLVKKTLIL
jgi:hypothetical protein